MAKPEESGWRRALLRAAVFAVVSAWLACAFWNSSKPMPPGTQVASLPARLAESQVEFLADLPDTGVILERELAMVDRAEQMIVLDQCPLTRALAEHLLARKRLRPNLKIVLATDPRDAVYGGTPADTLTSLERAGVIIARTRLERLRDSDPLYSSFWRLSIAWWSDPFDEVAGAPTLLSSLRQNNRHANQRQLLVADDGAGGWSAIVSAASVQEGAGSAGNTAVGLRGNLARDMIASELRVAAWSTDDDRLPPVPAVESRTVGSIDARYLTEGAIRAALRDAFGIAGLGDTIEVAVAALGDRTLVDAMLRAAARGAHLQLLLDPRGPANQAVAAELLRGSAGNVEIRWRIRPAERNARLLLMRHGDDVWLNVGSADWDRLDLDDLNLDAAVELHMPARSAPATAASEVFAQQWSDAAEYASHADESQELYWRYRFADATGLPAF